jgi:hypothetical protein
MGCKGILLDNEPLSMDVLLKGKGLSQHEMTYLSVRTET